MRQIINPQSAQHFSFINDVIQIYRATFLKFKNKHTNTQRKNRETFYSTNYSKDRKKAFCHPQHFCKIPVWI